MLDFLCLYCTQSGASIYNSPPLIRTPLLSNNSVLIREVSFGEREYCMYPRNLLSRIVSFLEGCPL